MGKKKVENVAVDTSVGVVIRGNGEDGSVRIRDGDDRI